MICLRQAQCSRKEDMRDARRYQRKENQREKKDQLIKGISHQTIVLSFLSLCLLLLLSACVSIEINSSSEDSLISNLLPNRDISTTDNANLQDAKVVDQTLEMVQDMKMIDQQAQVMMPMDMMIVDMQQLVDGWNVEMLNTAKNEPNFTDAEKEVIFRMNQARTNPSLFVTQFLEPMLARYSGNTYTDLSGNRWQTNEGPAAVQECINALRNASPLNALYPSQPLSRAAKAHARDSAMTGIVGHDSSDGTRFVNRLQAYTNASSFGENISYGISAPLEIVMGLLVDDGVSSRGHRENIMSPSFTHCGVGIDTHPTYRSICVIDYANSNQ